MDGQQLRQGTVGPVQDDRTLVMLPAELQVQLKPLRPVLTRYGVVKPVPGGYGDRFRLSFRLNEAGEVRRHSIEFSGRDNALILGLILNCWRKAERYKVLEAKERRLAEAKRKTQLAERRKEIVHLGGGGRRRRERNGREFDQAVAEGPAAVYLHAINAPFLKPNKKAGRPRKGALTIPAAET